ncbi:MAG: hypothetical protein ACR2MY_04295 [Candidatus Dormibacteria bacterium]
MRSRPSTPVLVGAVAFLVIVVGTAGWLVTRPHPAPGSQGITARVRPASIDSSPHGLNDGCFTSSRLQYAGRDGAQKEQFVLTMTLKNDPGSLGELVTMLDGQQCATALTRAVSSVRGQFKSDLRSGGLTISYRTAAGTRVQLP